MTLVPPTELEVQLAELGSFAARSAEQVALDLLKTSLAYNDWVARQSKDEPSLVLTSAMPGRKVAPDA